MKFCYNCGAKIEEGDKFCVECGAELCLADVEGNSEEKKHQEAELREAKRREEERIRLEEDRKRRDEDRKRLERLEAEKKEKERIETEKKVAEKKKSKAAVAFLLFLLAVIAVIFSVMYINEYNKKHDEDSSDTPVSGKNNPDLTVAPITTESYVSESTTASEYAWNTTENSNDSSDKRQYLDKEDLPKYFDGNMTLREIGSFFNAVEYAIAMDRCNSREEMFNGIVDGIWEQLPDLKYGKFIEMGEDKFVYEYLQYSYDDIKDLFTILFDDNEFDSFASNRNGYKYGAIIDKDSNIFSIFGGEYQIDDDFYDSYTNIDFYVEKGVYYIVYNGWILFTTNQKDDGNLQIVRYEKIDF